jgi:hypothetical protein
VTNSRSENLRLFCFKHCNQHDYLDGPPEGQQGPVIAEHGLYAPLVRDELIWLSSIRKGQVMDIFVGSLSFKTTEEELQKLFEE